MKIEHVARRTARNMRLAKLLLQLVVRLTAEKCEVRLVRIKISNVKRLSLIRSLSTYIGRT